MPMWAWPVSLRSRNFLVWSRTGRTSTKMGGSRRKSRSESDAAIRVGAVGRLQALSRSGA
jgi:hypothetical protein